MSAVSPSATGGGKHDLCGISRVAVSFGYPDSASSRRRHGHGHVLRGLDEHHAVGHSHARTQRHGHLYNFHAQPGDLRFDRRLQRGRQFRRKHVGCLHGNRRGPDARQRDRFGDTFQQAGPVPDRRGRPEYHALLLRDLVLLGYRSGGFLLVDPTKYAGTGITSVSFGWNGVMPLATGSTGVGANQKASVIPIGDDTRATITGTAVLNPDSSGSGTLYNFVLYATNWNVPLAARPNVIGPANISIQFTDPTTGQVFYAGGGILDSGSTLSITATRPCHRNHSDRCQQRVGHRSPPSAICRLEPGQFEPLEAWRPSRFVAHLSPE